MTVKALLACAAWNLEKGLQLLRWSKNAAHENDYFRNGRLQQGYTSLCRDAGRYLRNHDACIRKAWLLERQKHT